jgi:selenocysteine lyase/cysteine desulfurase
VFPGKNPLDLAVALDRRHEVKVRGGFHCAPLAHRRFDTASVGGAVRFAPGWFTSDADLARLDAALQSVLG